MREGCWPKKSKYYLQSSSDNDILISTYDSIASKFVFLNTMSSTGNNSLVLSTTHACIIWGDGYQIFLHNMK